MELAWDYPGVYVQGECLVLLIYNVDSNKRPLTLNSYSLRPTTGTVPH